MIDGFKIGHYTDSKNITGCTVILCPEDNISSCYIAGSAPGSREIALLSPERKIESVHAILLTGGSAFGLNAAAGVMSYLEEKGVGYQTSFGKIPIVPAAVIYDLNIGNPEVRPTAENAYNACRQAFENNTDQGNIGAGTGATVGKWCGIEHGMKGGLGFSIIKAGDLEVSAVTVVNSVGDIVDHNGETIAGALNDKQQLRYVNNHGIRWQNMALGMGENTVLSSLMTNARLTKTQVYLMTKRAQNGLARAISPANTSYDGDILFGISSNNVESDPEYVYEAAVEAMRQSIISAVLNANTLGSFISVQDLRDT
jgi:L-aminopeptidase/D-esterase-like protein